MKDLIYRILAKLYPMNLIEIEKLNQKDIFGSITEKEKKENLKRINIIAGGDKYSWFLSNFDNEEI